MSDNTNTFNFEDTYNHLNPEQKLAVDTIEGPVMVIAGPGTGKTQIMAIRIANILQKTQVNPSNILCLTFTNTAVANLTKRLVKIIGNSAHSVGVHTYHSLALELIQNNPDYFPNYFASSLITDLDKALIMEKVIDSSNLTLIRPAKIPHHHLGNLLKNISTLKREGYTPSSYLEKVTSELVLFENRDDLCHEKGAHKGKMKADYKKLQVKILKNLEIAKVYSNYQSECENLLKYDFDDLIIFVIEALNEYEDFRLEVREKYQYILVDEHQDSNASQNKILEILTAHDDSPNLFVVGDEKQAIYRFQGASIANFNYLKNLYPKTKLVTLVDNYRSTQNILDAAIALMSPDNESLLISNSQKPLKPINITPCENTLAEEAYLIEKIKAYLETDISPNEICILTRKVADAKRIAGALGSNGVAVNLMSNQNVLKNLTLKPILDILQFLGNFGQEDLLISILHLPFFAISPIDVFEILRFCSQNRKNIARFLDEVVSNNFDKCPIELSTKEKLKTMWLFLTNTQKIISTTPILKLIPQIIRESGYIDFLLSLEDPLTTLTPIRTLLDHLYEYENVGSWNLFDFLKVISAFQKHDLSLQSQNKSKDKSAVNVMNAHQAKGLEFEIVFVTGCNSQIWENGKASNTLPLLNSLFENDLPKDETDDNEKIRDEQRLFFVCLTRAKHELNLSYLNTSQTNKYMPPSMFLENINPELTNIQPTIEIQKVLNDNPQFGLVENSDFDTNQMFHKHLRDLFLNSNFSVSALNNFLLCPWKYYYESLLRIPFGKSNSAMYGTALHMAVGQFLLKKNHDLPTLLSLCKYYLEKQGFSTIDLPQILQKAKDDLSIWYAFHPDLFRKSVQIETKVSATHKVKIDSNSEFEIKLTGKIDLIINDPSNHLSIEVVDFKTGKPKSKNNLMGLTANGDSGYFRQLVFYAFMFEKIPHSKRVSQGSIDFLELKDEKKARTEYFDITKSDIKNLETELDTTLLSIYNLSFLNNKCTDENCKFCALRFSRNFKDIYYEITESTDQDD